jgi:predicted small secreted protein
MLVRKILVAAFACATLSLAACNTAEGVGEDAESVSDAVTK